MWVVRRSSPDLRRSGFSLVEVVVALLLLMLLVDLVGRTLRTSDSVIEGLEEWLEEGATWYLLAEPDPAARAMGVPAALVGARPSTSVGGSPNTSFDVEVIQPLRDVYGSTATAELTQS